METALYRKYRPQTFKDVLGQEHIVSVLEGAVERGNISHSYLFSGSRGTGKTSVARILSSAIGVSANDLYEIDAASNRGIDDIRELRDSIHTLPIDSPYKVYIIDEVHMLTKEAFNALLKTLEEPPKHVIFMLATTEIERLPETIVSRCQSFTFKKPSQQILAKMIKEVAKKEGYTISSASAELVSMLAEGSFRDAQGILQKILSSSKGKEVSIEEVELVTGAPKGELVNELVRALDAKDLKAGLLSVSQAVEQNIDMKTFIKLLLHKVRAILLLRFAPEMGKEFEEQFVKEDFELLKKIAEDKETNIDERLLYELLGAYDAINHSYIPQLPVELALTRLLKDV